MMIEIPALMLADVRRLLVCAQAAAAEAEARLLGRATERDALTSVAVVLNAALEGMTGSSQAAPASVRELPFDLATEVLGRVSPLHLPALLQQAHRALDLAACQLRPYLIATTRCTPGPVPHARIPRQCAG